MTKVTINSKYYPEIDILRGLTVVAMIIFHTFYQLKFIFYQNITASIWVWEWLPTATRVSFLILVGISLYLGKSNGKYNTSMQVLKRGGYLFGLGMGLTLITLLAKQNAYVYFGILHFIGLATIMSYYTLAWPKYINLSLGIIILGIGMTQQTFTFLPVANKWFLCLWPCHSNLFRHLDYHPIIPSIGFVFIGIFLGKVLYMHGRRNFNLDIPKKLLTYTSAIRWLGRRALLIYCIHTPIIFIITYIILYLKNLGNI